MNISKIFCTKSVINSLITQFVIKKYLLIQLVYYTYFITVIIYYLDNILYNVFNCCLYKIDFEYIYGSMYRIKMNLLKAQQFLAGLLTLQLFHKWSLKQIIFKKNNIILRKYIK